MTPIMLSISRHFLTHLGMTLLMCGALAHTAQAQKNPGLPGNYPSKPVRILIGTAPGGSTDFLSRTILGRVGEKWGATFVMENIASVAGGAIPLEAALKQPADGYTILTASGSTYQNATYSQKVSYDVRKVFTGAAQFTISPLVMGVNATLPVNNVKELIAYAKSKPAGELNLATSGIGSSSHLAGELLNLLAGIEMTSVPYKGVAPSVTDTIAGRTQITFGTSVALLPHVRSGKLKLLGITSPTRMSSLPDVPTIAEMGVPGYAYVGWIGAVVKTGTPPAIISALNQDAIQVIKSPEVQKALSADGSEPAYSSLEQFRETIDGALERAGKLIKERGLVLN